MSGFDSEEMHEKAIEHRPTIVLFLQHLRQDAYHSLYTIQPPLDISGGYGDMIDSDGYLLDRISPVLTFPDKNQFLEFSASVSLGSKIYFLGGHRPHLRTPQRGDRKRGDRRRARRLACRVQVFDLDHPEQGTRSVAHMKTPKESPCVFVADGMIYALGSPLEGTKNKPASVFERYNPSLNHWELLPDPPHPFYPWEGAELLDSATVVGRRVFIASLDAIFNLDTQTWDLTPHPEMPLSFPYSSLFVQDSASLYHLTGPGTFKSGTNFIPRGSYQGPLKVVKRGPVSTTKNGDCVTSFLKSVSLSSGKEHVMAEGLDLDEDIFFTDGLYRPWRELFHMGGRFFCYIVTAQLDPRDSSVEGEPNSRAVWIRFFEEVPVHTDNCTGGKCTCNDTKFRHLASFCHEIVTDFDNLAFFIRCSVLGTVPDSWIKSQQKFKQAWKPKQRNTGNRKTQDDVLKELLAVQEEENRRLAAELARKNKLLKDYEALLANTHGVVVV